LANNGGISYGVKMAKIGNNRRNNGVASMAKAKRIGVA
jgi:hypothetical protein